ncbi:MAG: VWA domain-containing protein [Christensenellales bacterium]
MGITSSNKTISKKQINCKDTFDVTLSLSAQPDIVSNPTDIVLILDRSGSMEGSPLANLKLGAKKFIEIIDQSTDSSQDGNIGGGSHIGIVSFATTATQDTGLITSVATLNAAVDALTSGGSTNHADAFTKALDLFDMSSTNAKVMVMFTDGVTTVGSMPAVVAAQAKAQGVIIYAIGLEGDGGIDEAALKMWASQPSSAYVAIAPDDSQLEDIFEDLAKNISKPGATDIVVKDIVSDCFKVVGVSSPTKGSALMLNDTTVQWKIDELGKTESEGASFTFTLQHLGECEGETEVDASIEYTDDEGNVVVFPSPSIVVDCDVVVTPEDCPLPVEVSIGGCNDSVEIDAGDLMMESMGRVLQLDVTLRKVCPNKRVALAAIVTELDENDLEYKRGLKTFVVPAHTKESCTDIKVRCIKFVLPEELDVSGTPDGICNTRRFRARFIAHYIDNDFDCCDQVE